MMKPQDCVLVFVDFLFVYGVCVCVFAAACLGTVYMFSPCVETCMFVHERFEGSLC